MSDETTTTKYITVQALSNNNIDSTPQLSLIKQLSNPIVENLADWNIYLTSLTINTSELPYFNIKRNVDWGVNNFATNKTNFSITLLDPTAANRNFSLAGNTNQLLFGVGNNTVNTWQGLGCYLQYVSENANATQYPNPVFTGAGANSQNYPRNYWNVHSIGQVMDMVNNAVLMILGKWTGGAGIQSSDLFFTYESDTQLYKLWMATPFFSFNFQMYFNGYLTRILDGFRTKFNKYTIC